MTVYIKFVYYYQINIHTLKQLLACTKVELWDLTFCIAVTLTMVRQWRISNLYIYLFLYTS